MLLIEEFQNLVCQVQFLERPMSEDPYDQLLLQIRGVVAEYERSLITERMRRGRRAKLRLDPAKSEIVRQMFAWYTDPQRRYSLYWIAKKLSDEGIHAPRGGIRWNVATIRGILPPGSTLIITHNSATSGMMRVCTNIPCPVRGN